MSYRWDKNDVVIVKKDKRNRYSLTCVWDQEKPAVTFVMINPSTGSVAAADRTLKRCKNFAQSWGYGSMKIVNLHSYISPKPDNLPDPRSLEKAFNKEAIKRAIGDSDKVIFAWGREGRDKEGGRLAANVIQMVDPDKRYCIEKSADGTFPKHPLFLSASLKPIRW